MGHIDTSELLTDSYDYELPIELIAQVPIPNRSDSRLLAMNRYSGSITHGSFCDILQYLRRGDCLVCNDTKVIPARLMGHKEDSGASIEILLLKQVEDCDHSDSLHDIRSVPKGCNSQYWEVMVKPGRKAKVGARILFGDRLKGNIIDILDNGNRIIKLDYQGIFKEVLDEVGLMPLPPYITQRLDDKDRYQTVYARYEGSAAAPTAGLHFTEELFNKIEDMGVSIAKVTLHVGIGTFRPVKVDNILEHHMHSEMYNIDEDTAALINRTKASGGRIICVGTTSCRTIESATNLDGELMPGSGSTDIFIYPGYDFKMMDGLITNFHLPSSTLLMLVSAFASREYVMEAYRSAIENQYRFFSFGDAMLMIGD